MTCARNPVRTQAEAHLLRFICLPQGEQRRSLLLSGLPEPLLLHLLGGSQQGLQVWPRQQLLIGSQASKPGQQTGLLLERRRFSGGLSSGGIRCRLITAQQAAQV